MLKNTYMYVGRQNCADKGYPNEARYAFQPMTNKWLPPSVHVTADKVLEVSCGEARPTKKPQKAFWYADGHVYDQKTYTNLRPDENCKMQAQCKPKYNCGGGYQGRLNGRPNM